MSAIAPPKIDFNEWNGPEDDPLVPELVGMPVLGQPLEPDAIEREAARAGLEHVVEAPERPLGDEDDDEVALAAIGLIAPRRVLSAKARRQRRPAGPAGLLPGQRVRARRLAVHAATLGYHHSSAIHYTQGSRRWDGINLQRRPGRGQYPFYADCSAYDSWALWVPLHLVYGLGDLVNGANWSAGFTGTILNHGTPISRCTRWGDLIIYGAAWPGHHVAMHVGHGLVISHGSEAGPLLLNAHYRPDIMARRRFL